MANGRSMDRPAHRVASLISIRPNRRMAQMARLFSAAMTPDPDRVLNLGFVFFIQGGLFRRLRRTGGQLRLRWFRGMLPRDRR
jgi:hypothetical protein